MSFLSGLWGGSKTTSPVDNSAVIATKDELLKKEIDQEATNSSHNTGVGLATEKIAILFRKVLGTPEARTETFKDVGKGLLAGLTSSGERGEVSESEEGLIRSIFNGIKPLTGEAVGQISAVALKVLLSNAKSFAMDKEDEDLLRESKNDLEIASKPLKDEKKTLSESAKKIFSAFSQAKRESLNTEHQEIYDKVKKEQEALFPPTNNNSSKDAKKLDRDALYETGKNVIKLLSYVSAEQTGTLFQKELQELNQTLKPLRSLYTTAQHIRERLSKYHVIVGGFDVSILLKWQEDKPSEEVKSINPISSLLDCQDKVRALKSTYALPLSSTLSSPESNGIGLGGPDNEDAIAKSRTDKSLEAFCTDVAELSTMKAVDHCFGTVRDDKIYKELLIEKGRVRQAYAHNCYKGLKKYLVQIPFAIIHSIVAPILTKMLMKLVEDMRDFLKDSISLLRFAEEKISDLSEYTGSFEQLRKQYQDSTHLQGRFLNFCKTKLTQYGDKFTEAELLNLFKDYIVENYTPRPKFKIRIPLFTSFTEWCIFSIRKAIIRSYLKQSKIIETYLEEGTSSIQLAQVGFKRLLVQKLKQLKEVMDSSLAKKASVTPIIQGESTLLSTEIAKANELRDRIIQGSFHDTIKEFSGKLVRFIDIEACNGDNDKLKRLDNSVGTLFDEFKALIQPFLPLETISLPDTMREACSNMTENVIVSIFQTTSTQVEEQLQGAIQLLQSSFTHYKEEKDRVAAHNERQKELKSLDENLKVLTQELSSTAVREAVTNKLDNVSGERHKRVVAFVEKEKEQAKHWLTTINEKKVAIQELFSDDQLNPQDRFNQIQIALGNVADLTDDYLRHLSSMLRSRTLNECYSDVQKTLFTTYKEVLSELSTKLIPAFEQVAAQNKQIYEWHQVNQLSQQVIETSQSVTAEQMKEPHGFAIATLKTLQTPLESKVDFKEQTKTLELGPGEIQNLMQKLAAAKTLAAKQKDLETLQGTLNAIETIERELTELNNTIREFHAIKRNRRYTSDEAVEIAKNAAKNTIVTKLATLQKNYPAETTDTHLFDNVLKPLFELKITSSDTLDLQTIHQLHDFLNQSFLKTTHYLFTPLHDIKKSLTRPKAELRHEIDALKKTLTEGVEVDAYTIAITEKTKSLDSAKEKLKSQFTTIQEANNTKIQEAIQNVAQQLEQVFASTQLIEQTSQKPHVMGYITVGELQLKETLSPKITSVVVPQVQEKMETVVKALEKPFHWKQLVLRLVMTDIAKRQSNK